jgi:signal transduction histidine kinase
MSKNSKLEFKQLWKNANLGGLFGIGISLAFMFAFDPPSLTYLYGISGSMNYIVTGYIAGTLITVGNNIVSAIFKTVYPRFTRIIWLLRLVIGCLVNFSIYYGIFILIGLILPESSFIDPVFKLKSSIEVGSISLVLIMFFIYLEEKEEKLKLEKENRELAVIEERNRIARELHDSVAQNLFGLNLNLNTLKIINESDPEKAKLIITQLQEMVAEVQTEMRLMIYELRPAALTEKGFSEAVDGLVSLFRIRYNIDVQLHISGSDSLISNQVQQSLYRILQESLNNVVKYAKAGKVIVLLTICPEETKLVVKDNGVGFVTTEINPEGHLGIQGMKERVAQLNGSFELKSTPDEGTVIMIKINNKTH